MRPSWIVPRDAFLRKCNKSSVKSMGTCQSTCSLEKSLFESFRENAKSTEQTVSQGNINK